LAANERSILTAKAKNLASPMNLEISETKQLLDHLYVDFVVSVDAAHGELSLLNANLGLVKWRRFALGRQTIWLENGKSYVK
jgi:hypothetical protein